MTVPNEGVRKWQQALLAHGYEVGKLDGEFGPATLRASLKALNGDLGGTNGSLKPSAEAFTPGSLTERMALEVISHEAIIREAYKDSKGIWTWSVGITSASGHSVERYKDNPQTLEHCIGVYVWLLNTKYLKEVNGVFLGHVLNEAQLCAALSFHYNTGAIRRASWVESFKNGRTDMARKEFMEWRKPPEIVKRRQAECDLFFDGRWSGDGKATVYEVSKPSYAPKWSSAKRVDVRADLKAAMV